MLPRLRLPARTALLAVLLAPLLGAQSPRVPTPSEVLGLPVGADRTLADWPQIVRYFGTLAQQSRAVKLDTLGRTTQGRPMILAAISTPENIARLPEILAVQAQLADPSRLPAGRADSLMARQPLVLWVSCNLHSTEIGSSQFAMEFAHGLVTSDSLQRALRDVVVLLVPSMNPDGMQLVVDWYKAQLGTPWEGGFMPWVYHQYVGHDNNRDWYMITQQETRVVSEALYTRYIPHVFWDVHQQGATGMRLTVPPHIDPINPNVDPRLVRGINLVGHRMAWALEQAGKTGVGDGVTYDLWWHGGARSTPTRHNMIGLLTEAASARIATPITLRRDQLTGAGRQMPRYEQRVNFPNPWPGGTWRLRDIMDYERIAGEALVMMASQQRGELIRATVAVARDQVARGGTSGFVIPTDQRDPGAALALVQTLRRGAVQVHTRDGRDDAATLAGRGEWVVPMAQPYAAHARDLLEVQRWPASAGDRPYDVAGWTLPLQMGVSVRMDGDVGRSAPAATGRTACALPAGRDVTISLEDSRGYALAFRALAAGRPVTWRHDAGGASVTVPRSVVAADTTLLACGLRSGSTSGAGRVLRAQPRVGLYRPWTANMDEGWTRWLFDVQSVRYTTVTDSVMRRGGLVRAFDVLIIPDMSLREARDGNDTTQVPRQYAGGLGEAGLRALAEFVAAGGTLVTFDKGAETALAVMPELGVTRLAPGPRRERDGRARDDTTGAAAGAALAAPGSILRTTAVAGHRLTAGMPDTVPVYFTNSSAFTVTEGPQRTVPLRYGRDAASLLMSGYLAGGETIAGTAATVDVAHGRGRVVLIGFRPQYRGQSWGTFKLLYNAILTAGTGR